MKDFDFQNYAKIEYVRQKFIDTCYTFGFRLMEPSSIELLSTLEMKSGESIKNEIYFFKDKSGREIALRFDFTMGITRYVTSNKSMRLPIKTATFGGVWRYDEPQKNRYRFFHQWNIEVYGQPNMDNDHEIIEFVINFFNNLGLYNVTVHISHKKLIESYINKIFNSNDPETVTDLCRAIDKTQKQSKAKILQEYKNKGYDINKLQQILKFASICGTPIEIEQNFQVQDLESWNELKKLFYLLHDDLNIDNIRINFGIVRGLDYYSGIIFEAFEDSSNVALLGGGRYDMLLKAFGRTDLAAIGVAGGIERMITLLDKQDKLNLNLRSRILIVSVNNEIRKNALILASRLRKDQIPVDVSEPKSFKKQLDRFVDYKFMIIIAPKEFSSGFVIVKNKSNNEYKVLLSEISTHLKIILSDK